MDLEEELKKLQMIEEEDIRLGVAAAKKKNKKGEESHRMKKDSSRAKEGDRNLKIEVSNLSVPVKESSKKNIQGQPSSKKVSSASIGSK